MTSTCYVRIYDPFHTSRTEIGAEGPEQYELASPCSLGHYAPSKRRLPTDPTTEPNILENSKSSGSAVLGRGGNMSLWKTFIVVVSDEK